MCLCIFLTLDSRIDVGQGINVGPGKFVKNNKHRALNKHRPWNIWQKFETFSNEKTGENCFFDTKFNKCRDF